MTARYEFHVYEHFEAVGTYIVHARTRAEALAKVLDGDEGVMLMGPLDPFPIRSISLRDVRRGRRIDTEPGDPS